MRWNYSHGYTTFPITTRVETIERYSHSYENMYYVTKVFKKYTKQENKYICDTYSYHFKTTRSGLVSEGKSFGIKKIGGKNMKELADILIPLQLQRKELLPFVVQKMDTFGMDRDCIRKIINSV